MLEAIDAACRCLRPAIGVDRLGPALGAAAHGRLVIFMDRTDMIAVAAIFHLHLPVAMEGVGGIAGQHFQTLGRLVDHLVDDDPGLAQMILQRQDIMIERPEDEAAIAFDPHLGQVVRPFMIETVGIGAGAGILGAQQLAVGLEAPAMEGADEERLVATLAAAQLGAAMGAGIDHAIEAAILGPRQDHRRMADPGGEIVVLLLDLALMGQIDPVALEDIFHLQIEQFRVGEDVAAAAENAGFRIVHDRGFNTVAQESHGAGHDPLSSQAGSATGSTASTTRRLRVEKASSPSSSARCRWKSKAIWALSP